MNFILCIIKFIKFKLIIKFNKFERHNYGRKYKHPLNIVPLVFL